MEQAIASGQRSPKLVLPLLLSNTFLKILAAPNKAVFCSKPVLMVIRRLSSHVSSLLLTAPSAPTTTCTTSTSTRLIPHNFLISH